MNQILLVSCSKFSDDFFFSQRKDPSAFSALYCYFFKHLEQKLVGYKKVPNKLIDEKGDLGII